MELKAAARRRAAGVKGAASGGIAESPTGGLTGAGKPLFKVYFHVTSSLRQ